MHFLYALPAAFFAPIIHEMLKALISKAQGDRTPGNSGFITFNPLKFFEPIGFILMLIFNIGWAQPVPTSSLHYKDRKKGMIITYTAPAVICILIGLIFTFSLGFLPFFNVLWFVINFLARGFVSVGVINLLIPVNPFALHRLLPMFLSPQKITAMNQYERPMQIIMIVLIAFGFLPMIVNPIVNMIMNLAAL